MTTPDQSARELDAISQAAARWTVRRDRGLSAGEAIEFELWLAADARHAEAMRLSGGAWTLLHRVPDDLAQRELASAALRRVVRRRIAAAGSFAAAAAFAIAAIGWWRGAEPANPAHAAPALLAAGPRVVTLADGTLVRLKAGGAVVEDFDAAERRVRLTRGEAHFTVVENPARPFVVVAGTLRAQAVGTAFNVHLQSTQVEVLVTEGRVRLATREAPAAPAPVLEAGERAVVSTAKAGKPRAVPAIVVTRVDAAEMARTLAWHDSLMRLGGATLAELVEDYERRFGQRVVVADPEIAYLRAGGRLRADDAEHFVNLLAATFDLDVERAADGSLVLRKKNSKFP